MSGDFYGLGENYFFYPICKDTLSIPRPGVFKDIGVLRGKEQKECQQMPQEEKFI